MDCRWTFCLAAALLTGAVGCDAKTLPLWPAVSGDSAGHPPTANTPNSSESSANPKPPSANLVFPEVKELKPATLVAFAALKEQSTAKSPAQAEANREEARKAYLQALKQDPTYVPAHLGIARLFELQNNHARALEHYRKALKLAPNDSRNWLEVGMCHARHKEWNQAIEHLRKASQLDPDNQSCGKYLGLCLARAGKPDEALLCLLNVEGEAQAHYTVARMMHHLKQDEASKQYARQALVADPKLEGAQQLLNELEGGETAQRRGTSVSIFESAEEK